MSADFEAYAERGFTLHLNTDVREAWGGFLAARCLIVAKSSFSYVPAVLRTGPVVYEPFWHLPATDAWFFLGDVVANRTRVLL